MNALRQLQETAPAVAAVPTRPTDIAVHLVHQGRIRLGNVSTRLPREVSDHSTFLAAPLMPDADAVLEAIRSTATRCVPWVRVAVGPRLWINVRDGENPAAFRRVRGTSNGGMIREIQGQAWTRACGEGQPEIILVARWCSAVGALTTLHHEIWHIVEHHVHRVDFRFVDAAAGKGIALPGNYLDSAIERRARLYENWASAYDEGWRPTSLFGVPLSRVDRIFLAVHRGDVAADRAAGRPSPARLLPGERALRAARAFAGQIRGELGWQGILLSAVAAATLARWL